MGAPKAGGGPAVGAYGCSAELAPFIPGPVVIEEDGSYRLDHDRPQSAGKVRGHWGNVPQLVYAYTWSRAMGAQGIREASDVSVLLNNSMEKRLLALRGVTKSHPHPRCAPQPAVDPRLGSIPLITMNQTFAAAGRPAAELRAVALSGGTVQNLRLLASATRRPEAARPTRCLV